MAGLAVRVQESGDMAQRVRLLSNDALIIALINTLNHLSRWLTPVHDRTILEFSPRRSEPSVKDLLIDLRDTEAQTYAVMYAIAAETNPDLDRVPRIERTPLQVSMDRMADPLVIMSGFRRVRESSTSLLRALPDTAWERGGFSRTARDWTIRELAEYLAAHDGSSLHKLDLILARSGARDGIAGVSQVRFDRIDEPFVSSAERD